MLRSRNALVLSIGLLAGCTNSPTTTAPTTTNPPALSELTVTTTTSTPPAGGDPTPTVPADPTTSLTPEICETNPTTGPDAIYCDRLANDAPDLIANLTADYPDLYTATQLECIANHYAQLPRADINHIRTSIFDQSSPSAAQAEEIISTMFATCDAPTPPDS